MSPTETHVFFVLFFNRRVRLIDGRCFLSLRVRGTWRQAFERIWIMLCVEWGKITDLWGECITVKVKRKLRVFSSLAHCNKVVWAPLNVVKLSTNRRNNPDFTKAKQLDSSKFVYYSYCRTIKVSTPRMNRFMCVIVRKRKFKLTEIIFTVFTRVNVCKIFSIRQFDKRKSRKKNNDHYRFIGTDTSDTEGNKLLLLLWYAYTIRCRKRVFKDYPPEPIIAIIMCSCRDKPFKH